MAKKNGRPAWFKMFLNQKAIIDAASNETAGKALKAAESAYRALVAATGQERMDGWYDG